MHGDTFLSSDGVSTPQWDRVRGGDAPRDRSSALWPERDGRLATNPDVHGNPPAANGGRSVRPAEPVW